MKQRHRMTKFHGNPRRKHTTNARYHRVAAGPRATLLPSQRLLRARMGHYAYAWYSQASKYMQMYLLLQGTDYKEYVHIDMHAKHADGRSWFQCAETVARTL